MQIYQLKKIRTTNTHKNRTATSIPHRNTVKTANKKLPCSSRQAFLVLVPINPRGRQGRNAT